MSSPLESDGNWLCSTWVITVIEKCVSTWTHVLTFDLVKMIMKYFNNVNLEVLQRDEETTCWYLPVPCYTHEHQVLKYRAFHFCAFKKFFVCAVCTCVLVYGGAFAGVHMCMGVLAHVCRCMCMSRHPLQVLFLSAIYLIFRGTVFHWDSGLTCLD